jgi:hypothetical protein
MLVRTNAIPSVAVLAVGWLSLTMPPAEALTMKECGAKYQAGKNLWHSRWTELERVSQNSMRARCCSHSCSSYSCGHHARGAEGSGERGLPHGRVAEVHE